MGGCETACLREDTVSFIFVARTTTKKSGLDVQRDRMRRDEGEDIVVCPKDNIFAKGCMIEYGK